MDDFKEKVEKMEIEVLHEELSWLFGGPTLRVTLKVILDDAILYKDLKMHYPNKGYANLDTWGFTNTNQSIPDSPIFRSKVTQFLNKRLEERLKNERSQVIPKVIKHEIVWEPYKDNKKNIFVFRTRR